MRGEILLVVPDFFERGGGIARISRAMASALQGYATERDAQLTVIALHDSSQERDQRLLRPDACFRGFSGDRNGLSREVVRRGRGGSHLFTVFCHVNLAALGLLYRRSVLGRTYVVVAHGVDVWGELPLHRRFALRHAREVWPVSEFTGKALLRHGVDRGRIRVIHNCLDPNWPLDGVSQEPAEPPFVLAVSRLCRGDSYKGVDQLIHAFGEVARELPALRLVIVGDGDDMPRLRALAAGSSHPERIAFKGTVGDSDLRDLLASCQFFALPSSKEGFGLVYLEAMAFRKAVLAARCTAVPEIVKDGETGLLVPNGDRAALADAVRTLASDASLARRLGEAGWQRVRERFTFDHYRRRVWRALDDVIAPASLPSGGILA